MNDIFFLELEEVLKIHAQLIEAHGGSHGVRDTGALISSLETPKSGFGDEYFHKSIFDKASAYLFHIAKNHPFIDGNKRIAFACADVFLLLNGYRLKGDKFLENNYYDFVIEVASSHDITKEKIASFLESNSEKL
ncbi:MAG: type II toxin-antitoxin system death-on-curing family toxin [Candidatus Sericytochromatia bacterium]